MVRGAGVIVRDEDPLPTPAEARAWSDGMLGRPMRHPLTDSLADVIREATAEASREHLTMRTLDAVRAHLAAVLDAESADWRRQFYDDPEALDTALVAVDCVRGALGVERPPTTGA
jgi:hypothetical protein